MMIEMKKLVVNPTKVEMIDLENDQKMWMEQEQQKKKMVNVLEMDSGSETDQKPMANSAQRETQRCRTQG